MSLDKLLEFIQNPNIAKDLSDDKLQIIGREVIERADIDEQSMREWKESVDHGIKLCKPEFKPKDKPWPDAANYKSTILTEAANNFGNRASVEIMRSPNLVKTEIIGLTTIKNVIDKRFSDITKRKDEIEQITAMIAQIKESGAPPDEQLQKAEKLLQELTDKTKADEEAIKVKKDELRKRNERADRVAEFANWQLNVKMDEWRSDQKRLMYSLPNVGSMFKKTFFDGTLGRCVSKVIQYPDF
jgi:DNA repair exonuclease SbcCD ATPase subunit